MVEARPGARQSPRFSFADVIAGVSVALILVPQSLAYAEIAGVPSYVGLYAAALPPIAAALFASSPYLQTGPVAMTSLLTFGSLTAVATPFSPEWMKLAALLAVLVGVVRLGVGVLRAGVVSFLMSQPTLLGFTSGAAILIVGSQLPKAFGVVAEGDRILGRVWWTLSHPGAWDWWAVALAAVTVAVVVLGRRLHPLFPGVLAAVVIGIGFSVVTGYEGLTVGEIPAGLPPIGFDLPWSSSMSLILPAVVIALVGFAEPSAIARSFATEERMRWSPNREFVSQGVANIASGLSGGFPVGGSFSRSSVNRMAGARSRWSGAVTGVTVFAFLFVASLLEPLPLAVLAGIVISAMVTLIRPDRIVGVFKSSMPQGVVAAVTFVATLALAPRIEYAIVLGIVLGVGVHLWRELAASVGSDYVDQVLTIRPSGVMFFGSAPALSETLIDLLDRHQEAEVLVLNLSRLGRLDYTGALALRDLIDDARRAGLEVRIENVPRHSRRIVAKVLSD